jgi:hypothetical protein
VAALATSKVEGIYLPLVARSASAPSRWTALHQIPTDSEDSARAKKCHDFLAELGGTDNTSPSATS